MLIQSYMTSLYIWNTNESKGIYDFPLKGHSKETFKKVHEEIIKLIQMNQAV